MKKFFGLMMMAALVAMPVVGAESVVGTATPALSPAGVLAQNNNRPHKYEGRKRHRGIGRAYGKAGKSAAKGGKDFARNIARGKPIKASRRLGKGVGAAGKHTGQGTARVGRKVGRKIKKVLQ